MVSETVVEKHGDIQDVEIGILLGWTAAKVPVSIRPVVKHQTSGVRWNVGRHSLDWYTVDVEHGLAWKPIEPILMIVLFFCIIKKLSVTFLSLPLFFLRKRKKYLRRIESKPMIVMRQGGRTAIFEQPRMDCKIRLRRGDCTENLDIDFLVQVVNVHGRNRAIDRSRAHKASERTIQEVLSGTAGKLLKQLSVFEKKREDARTFLYRNLRIAKFGYGTSRPLEDHPHRAPISRSAEQRRDPTYLHTWP